MVAYGNYSQGFAIDPIGVIANQGHTDPAAFPSPGFRRSTRRPDAGRHQVLPGAVDQPVLPFLSRDSNRGYQPARFDTLP